MKIVEGNLWDFTDDAIFVTTNATIRKDGELVMGRGAAKEMKEQFSIFPKVIGDQISRNNGSGGKYGLYTIHPFVFNDDGSRKYGKILGAFQVKYNWWEKADLDLIEYSTDALLKSFETQLKNLKVSMNFPGIGNGKLAYDEVYPIIEKLPDSVSVYRKED